MFVDVADGGRLSCRDHHMLRKEQVNKIPHLSIPPKINFLMEGAKNSLEEEYCASIDDEASECSAL